MLFLLYGKLYSIVCNYFLSIIIVFQSHQWKGVLHCEYIHTCTFIIDLIPIGPYITKLPTKRDDLLECSSLANETHPPKSLPIQCEIPTCIVIYVVMKGAGQEGTKVEREDEHPVSQEVLDVMRVFSSVLAKEDIPEETRNRLVIQVKENQSQS